jgi:transcriptional regulator with XRE-family HTH domain
MNGEEMTSPGGWLKRQRKARDLTQDALAEQVGCSPDTVRKIEAGKQRPSQQLAGLLAARLEVPPTERAALIHWLRSSIPSASLPGDGTPIPMPLIAAPPPRNGPRPLPVPLTSLIGREGRGGQGA